MRPTTRDYVDVDSSPDPASLLAALDKAERLTPHIDARERTYDFLPVGVGVDIGCGSGRAVADLRTRGVDAIGVDPSDFLVEASRRRFPDCTFLRGSAAALPFRDHSLQWYRAERVYQHLSDPTSALHEARRVLTPGGTIIVEDQDFDSMVITSADPALTRRILDSFTNSLPHGRCGSRMRGTLAQAGFTDIAVTAIPAVYTELDSIMRVPAQAMSLAVDDGILFARQAASWMADLEQLDRDEAFIVAYLIFITTARSR